MIRSFTNNYPGPTPRRPPSPLFTLTHHYLHLSPLKRQAIWQRYIPLSLPKVLRCRCNLPNSLRQEKRYQLRIMRGELLEERRNISDMICDLMGSPDQSARAQQHLAHLQQQRYEKTFQLGHKEANTPCIEQSYSRNWMN